MRPHSDKISHKLGLAAHEKPFLDTLWHYPVLYLVLKRKLSNWIVLFSFHVCYNYTKGEIQERVWENIWKKIG